MNWLRSPAVLIPFWVVVGAILAYLGYDQMQADPDSPTLVLYGLAVTYLWGGSLVGCIVQLAERYPVPDKVLARIARVLG
jgi:Na+/melibiose symporter-like transporter